MTVPATGGVMKVTMLGCGGSQGVPTPVGDWGVCDPADPRNQRLRPSILIEVADKDGAEKRLLVDTGPDLRTQLLRADIRHVDAVLYTHAHADHLHGIDELRSLNRAMGAPISIFGSAEMIAEIERRFGYVVQPPPETGFYFRPTLLPNVIDGEFTAAGITVNSFVQDHGYISSLGFRIGSFAYSTDVVRLDEAAFAALAGVDVWIVDCLRDAPHPTHSHLAQTLDWIARVKPRRAILTHMDPVLDYAELAARLPGGVEPGRDGLVIEI